LASAARRAAAPSADVLHHRVKKARGPASNYPCVDCGGPAQDWSTADPSSDDVWARFQPRCRKCHRRYDGAVGEGNPRAKLTAEKVRELRARRADGLTYRQLAAEFGISDVSAYAAVNRRTWAHVALPPFGPAAVWNDRRMAVTYGRVALVTGSSRGLGAVIARRLANDGLAVAVNGRPGDELVAAVSRAIRDDGGAAEGFCADVTDEHQVAGLVAAITDRLGPVDVLVLNATGPQPEAPIADVDWAGHLAQLDFFVKSPVLLGRAVLPGMQARRYGRIVHIDSEVAHRPPPGRSAYATAKNAQIGLTISWARELAPSGITVNTVAPGFIPVERHADVPDHVKQAYLASVPAGRMGTPADIAHAVSFLVSDGAGFITGQRIIVDGGRSLGT
jgi:3-oxoacyl-[acyl-carrier protein] reductase